ncbi:recombinase family protein [Streptomyces sp. NPDC050738]|uniref:recombinase family protein n=1 Tax=Streptomyces sp. NPDC050738 TaxID=3154744 RepID=UPI003422E931
MGEGSAVPATAGDDPVARPRAVSYLRVSRPQQIDGFGIPYQRARTSEFIEERGWAQVGEFVDLAFSGRTPAGRRPGFAQLLKQAETVPCPFDMVVVSEGRAVGRAGREFWQAVWALEDLGVLVVVASDDPADSLLKQADFAETEWAAVRRRTQGGLQAKALEGGHPGGALRYGYRIAEMPGSATGSVLVVDECDGGPLCVVMRDGECSTTHEAVVLRRARELVVEHGGNIRRACVALNGEGFLNRSGGPWAYENLRKRLLGSDFLEGRYVFRDPGRNGGRGTQLGHDGQPLHGDTVVLHLVPVFSAEQIAELRAVVATRSRRKSPSSKVYPLTGRLRAPCGGWYRGGTPEGGHPEYRCSGKTGQFTGAPRCDCGSIRANAVDEWAWERICAALADVAADGVSVEVRQADTQRQGPDRLAVLDRRILEQRKAVDSTSTEIDRLRDLPGVVRPPAVAVLESAARLLADDLARMVILRGELAVWQQDEPLDIGQTAHAYELVEKAKGTPGETTWEERAELFAYLDIRIDVYDVPPRPRGGDRCSVGTWFRQCGREVPVLTDEAWNAVEPLVTVQGALGSRQIVEAMLHKAATGISWPALDRLRGGFFHQYWKRWNRNGVWAAVVRGLAQCETVPVHVSEMLPVMSMTGSMGSAAFSAVSCPEASSRYGASGPSGSASGT